MRAALRRAPALFGLAWLAVAWVGPTAAFAHVVSDRDVRLFRALPAGAVADAFRAARPDSAGLSGANRPTWRHVALQQDALALLMDAASRADSAAAESAWRAMDAIFLHQKPDSLFESTPGTGQPRDPAATVALLGAVCRAEVAIENGPLRDRFHWRIVLMLPKLRRALESVVARGEGYAAASANDPAALLAGAQALLLGDGIFHVERFGLLGQRLLVDGLALQKSGGQFVVTGGDPLAAQADCLLALQSILNYYPAPSLERAAANGAKWLESRTKNAKTRSPRVGFALACAAAQPAILRSTPAARTSDR